MSLNMQPNNDSYVYKEMRSSLTKSNYQTTTVKKAHPIQSSVYMASPHRGETSGHVTVDELDIYKSKCNELEH